MRMWIKVKINKNNGKNFIVLNVAFKIPEKLKSVIKSMERIIGREISHINFNKISSFYKVSLFA